MVHTRAVYIDTRTTSANKWPDTKLTFFSYIIMTSFHSYHDDDIFLINDDVIPLLTINRRDVPHSVMLTGSAVVDTNTRGGMYSWRLA